MHVGRIDRYISEDSLEELYRLTESAGAHINGSTIVKLQKPVAATYIGSGKAKEIALLCREQNINVVIFDANLTPVQVKNLELCFGIKVIDRTELILDIFAQHAQTREGKLQIEMAQLMYLYPRLTG